MPVGTRSGCHRPFVDNNISDSVQRTQRCPTSTKINIHINIEKYPKSSSGNLMHCLGEVLTYSSALAEEKDPMPLLFP